MAKFCLLSDMEKFLRKFYWGISKVFDYGFKSFMQMWLWMLSLTKSLILPYEKSKNIFSFKFNTQLFTNWILNKRTFLSFSIIFLSPTFAWKYFIKMLNTLKNSEWWTLLKMPWVNFLNFFHILALFLFYLFQFPWYAFFALWHRKSTDDAVDIVQ